MGRNLQAPLLLLFLLGRGSSKGRQRKLVQFHSPPPSPPFRLSSFLDCFFRPSSLLYLVLTSRLVWVLPVVRNSNTLPPRIGPRHRIQTSSSEPTKLISCRDQRSTQSKNQATEPENKLNSERVWSLVSPTLLGSDELV